ncbi:MULTISPECIES: hypothetical protein [Halomonadaceae]|uniref:Uncharacterized protein n=3 Tax=Vreelandella TaxID=3137766 RepID=A0A7Z0RWY4_9GAMM|nr:MULTISPECIES: hypothetical protein [Halomonas]AJY50673.1 hypothetical protein KO116_02198 [Halomonas sp. KO116]NVF12939.1 hypothetical protein [Halomonas maris]NYS76621.1 hypothetical protein [Halomonas glaciei]|tara:strand:+ start:165121 stop:165264 length:144 start_codon:yes stop_codon:yes gene_type:complete
MNELILASMLMSLAVVSGGMVWSQYREHHGKKSLTESAFSWIAKRFA